MSLTLSLQKVQTLRLGIYFDLSHFLPFISLGPVVVRFTVNFYPPILALVWNIIWVRADSSGILNLIFGK